MRGKVLDRQIFPIIRRITPAYAGKSYVTVYNGNAYWDHPRLCGEKPFPVHGARAVLGSPPPMRGKDLQTWSYENSERITPAYAGKSWKTQA